MSDDKDDTYATDVAEETAQIAAGTHPDYQSASPRPWRWRQIDESVLEDAGGYQVGEITFMHSAEDADLIVRAVNMHSELVEALERMVVEQPRYDDPTTGFCFYCHEVECDPAPDCAYQSARALLARVKEPKP